MKRKSLAILLTLTLALSLSIPAFATTYSDLTGHWAETYLKDLVGRGFLTGYDDGTMRPDKDLTACEALVLLSRFYSPDTGELAIIEEDYKDDISDTVSSSLAWADDQLAVCLAAGIITKTELKSIDLTADISKEQFSVFLCRAIQIDDEAEALTTTAISAALKFGDTSAITSGNKKYIAELVLTSLVGGDDNNNFGPQGSLTRAVAATMVSGALSYLKTEDTTLTIAAYDGIARTEGIIESVGTSTLSLRALNGFLQEYTIASSTSTTVNDVTKTLSTAYANCYAVVTSKNGTATTVAITSDSSVTWVQGMVYNAYVSTEGNILYIKKLDETTATKYVVPSSAVLTQNGSTISYGSLWDGYFATVEFKNSAVAAITSMTGDATLTGTVSSIDYGTTVTLEITDSDGIVYPFLLSITDLPTITRDGTTITIDRLKAGDTVVVTMDDCELSSIKASNTENTVTGELTSITSTTGGTTWTIKATDGTTGSYTVDENAGVYSGTTAILLSDIQPGDTVEVVVYGTTITEIYLKSSSTSGSSVTGTVMTINTSTKTIMILNSSDKLIHVDASSVSYIISTSTGTTLSFSSIKADETITAYGSYTDSTTFKAVSLLVST